MTQKVLFSDEDINLVLNSWSMVRQNFKIIGIAIFLKYSIVTPKKSREQNFFDVPTFPTKIYNPGPTLQSIIFL